MFTRSTSRREPRDYPILGIRSVYPGSLRPLASSLRPQMPNLLIPVPEPVVGETPKRKRSYLVRLALACLAAYAVAALAAPAFHVDHVGHVGPSIVSGRAGVKSTADGKPQQWHKPQVSLVLDPSLDKIGPGAKDAVRAAVGTWIDSAGKLPQISFDVANKPARAEQDGVNRVLRGRITVPGHENDVAVTIGYVDDATGNIVEADIVFNDRYDFNAGDTDDETSCDGRYDLGNVATHEAGHFFGLGEDMTDPDATMYYRSAPCETKKRVLTAPDVEVIDSLYQQSSDLSSGSDPASDVSSTGTLRSAGCN